MCITTSPAELTKTKILSLKLESGNHFIAYSNRVKSTSGKPNAMILPIPGETKPEWFHDTTEYKNFLNEIVIKSKVKEYYMGMKPRSLFHGNAKDFEKFDLGIYSVALAKDFKGIEEFLKQLPEEKQPSLSADLKYFFLDKYAGWSFAICLFDANKVIESQPIAFEYNPFNKEVLYFPTMDSHDGEMPKMNSNVLADHTFITEHTGQMFEQNNNYVKKFVTLEANVPNFLQNKKYRTVFSKGYEKNADTYINISNMTESDFLEDFKTERLIPTIYPAANFK